LGHGDGLPREKWSSAMEKFRVTLTLRANASNVSQSFGSGEAFREKSRV
jgi:hypothetical protein